MSWVGNGHGCTGSRLKAVQAGRKEQIPVSLPYKPEKSVVNKRNEEGFLMLMIY